MSKKLDITVSDVLHHDIDQMMKVLKYKNKSEFCGEALREGIKSLYEKLGKKEGQNVETTEDN